MLEKMVIRKMAQMELIRGKDSTSGARNVKQPTEDIVLIATSVEKVTISAKIAQKISRHRSGGG